MKKIIIILLLIPYLLNGATYYVATNGNNGNTGTSASPWLTIQKGADEANAGDTVIVRDGTYTASGDWLVLLQGSGSAGNPIVFKSENEHGAILDGQNARDYGFLLYGGIDYINIIDFEIKNMLYFAITANNANATSYVEISGCHIHHIGRVCDSEPYGRSGMYLSNVSTWIIEGCIINDIGRYAAGESGCSPSTEYYKNHDHGIYVDGATGVIIRNNVFYNCNRGWALHFYPDPCSNISIFNNTFDYGNMWLSHGSYGSHIIIDCNFSNSYIKNNLFSRDYDYAIFRSTGTFSAVQIYNNLSYGGDGNLMYGSTSGIIFSNNLEDTDPLMTDDENYDFTLTALSPAIDAGVNVGLDYSGDAPDLGAFEYDEESPPVTHGYIYHNNKMIFKGDKIITK
jgi:hypothetical protein